jgi:hypothetical protein
LAPRVPRNSVRRPQSLVEPKWPDGAEMDRWSGVIRVNQDVVGFEHVSCRNTQKCGSDRAGIVCRPVDRLRNGRKS